MGGSKEDGWGGGGGDGRTGMTRRKPCLLHLLDLAKMLQKTKLSRKFLNTLEIEECCRNGGVIFTTIRKRKKYYLRGRSGERRGEEKKNKPETGREDEVGNPSRRSARRFPSVEKRKKNRMGGRLTEGGGKKGSDSNSRIEKGQGKKTAPKKGVIYSG